MKKIITLLLVFLNLYFTGISQDLYKNHQKYWYLKSKLTNDFMKVGLNQGESIPFAQRGLYTNVNGTPTSYLSGGDLISELGIYIAVLATEYKLLKLNNQNTDSVKHELYCALNAINRLDYAAEPMYGSYSSSTDGFLVRDDIPRDFVEKNYKHFNYYNTWDGLQSSTNVGHIYNRPLDDIHYPNTINTDRGFHSIIEKGQCETGSVFYSNFQYENEHPGQGNGYGNYAMSQDHVISLMYGLRLVSEYVDGDAMDQNQHFHYGDEAYYSIKDEAGVISNRLVQYLKSHHWRIKKPNGSDVSDNEGGNVKAYAYALAQIAGIINQPNNGINHWDQFQCPVPTVDQAYHDTHTKTLGFEEFQTVAKSPGSTFDLITQIAELSAACQCLFNKVGGNTVTVIIVILEKIWKWLGSFFGWILNAVLTAVESTLPISWQNKTLLQSIPNSTVLNPNASRLAQRIKYQQDYSLLTNLLLQNEHVSNLDLNLINTYNSVLSRTSDILNNAPCDGPRNFTYGQVFQNGSSSVSPSYDVFEWSGYSLVEHANIMGSDNIDHVPGSAPDTWGLQSGEYNGLDYMLYHNLYYLYKATQEGSAANSIDLNNRFINYTIPTSNGTGSQGNPTTIGAFEHIIENGTINSNADVHFLSGKDFQVIHGTNYEIKPGAQVSVDIYRYNCSNNNYLSGNVMRTANPGKDTNDVYGPVYAVEKLHEVVYPEETKKNSKTAKNQQNASQQLLNKKITSLNDKISLFPNPNNGNFSIIIDAKNDEETYSIYIYDITGKAIQIYENVKAVNGEIKIQSSNLTEGTYLVRAVGIKNGKQFTEKVIVKY